MAVIDARMDQLIKQKAERGEKLSNYTPEKQKIYDLYQTNAKNRIEQAAMSGRQLHAPNQWKTGLYQQFQQKPIDDMFNKSKGYLDNMYNQQKESQLQAMKAQRDKAIGAINQQKSQLKPQYQTMRNQTDAVNQQNVMKLRELMAANGLSASGENVSANVSMNNERVNSLNQLNLQEQQATNEFDQRIADINNPAEEQALIAQIEADRSRALYEARNQAENMGYQRLRDTVGDNRYNQEWSAQEQQRRMDNAWRTHTFNNMSAAEKKQFEWNKQTYGEDKAWQMFALQYQGELDKSMAQTELDFYNSPGFLTP